MLQIERRDASPGAAAHIRLAGLLALFASSLLLSGAPVAPSGYRSSDGPLLYLRLSTHLTSYRFARGAEFQAVVIRPYERDGQLLLPAGTIVRGTVMQAKAVGLALVRERASLQLDFSSYELPDGRRRQFSARLRRIDNARESVTRQGQIRGILAAQTPHSFMSGVWHTPSIERMPRALMGLAGAPGRIAAQYSLGPIGEAGIIAARCAMFRLPEPEISLPTGTELQAVVTELPVDAPTFELAPPGEIADTFAHKLAVLPVTLSRATGGTDSGDIINVTMVGSRAAVMRAFALAGWSEAEPLTRRSLSRAYKAYMGQNGYATAPVSKLLYAGAEPDLVFQKSFNTITKRHHIRLWRMELAGQELWLGAATHDIGVEFTTTSLSFTHKIHPRIDLERAKVVADLEFTGAVEPAAYVPRPAVVRLAQTPRDIATDGCLAVLHLREDHPPAFVTAAQPTGKPPLTAVARLARRMVLEARHYVVRGNVYYWAYRGLTWKHHRQSQVWETDD